MNDNEILAKSDYLQAVRRCFAVVELMHKKKQLLEIESEEAFNAIDDYYKSKDLTELKRVEHSFDLSQEAFEDLMTFNSTLEALMNDISGDLIEIAKRK